MGELSESEAGDGEIPHPPPVGVAVLSCQVSGPASVGVVKTERDRVAHDGDAFSGGQWVCGDVGPCRTGAGFVPWAEW